MSVGTARIVESGTVHVSSKKMEAPHYCLLKQWLKWQAQPEPWYFLEVHVKVKVSARPLPVCQYTEYMQRTRGTGFEKGSHPPCFSWQASGF